MQISPTYVKQAYSLAWRFFIHNKKVSFLAMLILVGMAILSAIPLLGIIFYVGTIILLFSLQTYVAKTLIASDGDEDYNEKVQATGIKELLTKHLGIAGGGLVGFIAIEIIFAVVIFTIFAFTIGLEALSTLNDPNMPPQRQLELFQSIGLMGIVFMFVMMFFTYINPIVLGNFYASENFGEAFSAIFTMFSPTVWKASFKGEYFLIVTMLHLTVIAMFILIMISIMTLVLIPVAIFIGYMLVLYATITSVLAREIVFEGHEQELSTDE